MYDFQQHSQTILLFHLILKLISNHVIFQLITHQIFVLLMAIFFHFIHKIQSINQEFGYFVLCIIN
jgi:hypothetical protein